MINPLTRIARDTGNPQFAAELQDAIRQGVAFLFVRGEDGFVLKPQVEDGVVGVLVWAGWGDGGAPARHLPEVKQLARRIGARWVRFHSARKGWLRVAPAMGWQRQPDGADGLYVYQINL